MIVLHPLTDWAVNLTIEITLWLIILADVILILRQIKWGDES